MSEKSIAEVVVETLIAAGVKRIYGVVGDSLNALLEAMAHHKDEIEWVHVRHEEAGAFAAGAEAQVTGGLAVCAGSCGPGNVHLINGLYDCQRSRVPVLAIAAHIPSSEIGSSYFQETNVDEFFRGCSHYSVLVSQASQMPRVLETAIQTSLGQSGVTVVSIPGDVAIRRSPRASRASASGTCLRARCRPRRRSPRWPTAQRGQGGDHPRRRGLCRRARGADAGGRQAQGADRHHAARPRARAVRQPQRRRAHRADRLRLRLPRDDGLRHAAHPRRRLPLPAVLPDEGDDPAGRLPRREPGPAHADRARARRRREGDGHRAAAEAGGPGRRRPPAALHRALPRGAQGPRRPRRRPSRAQADPPAVRRADDRPARGGGCDLHLRRRHADGLGRALPDHERPAAAARLVQPRLHGQCRAAGHRRAARLSQAAGGDAFRRRRPRHDARRPAHAAPVQSCR